MGGGGAKHAFVATIGDRSVAGPSDGRHSCRPCCMGAPHPKTSFGRDGKKQLSRPTNDLQWLFHGSARGWVVGERSTPSRPTIGDRSVAGPSDGRHSCRPCCMRAHPPKQVLAPTRRNRCGFLSEQERGSHRGRRRDLLTIATQTPPFGRSGVRIRGGGATHADPFNRSRPTQSRWYDSGTKATPHPYLAISGPTASEYRLPHSA